MKRIQTILIACFYCCIVAFSGRTQNTERNVSSADTQTWYVSSSEVHARKNRDSRWEQEDRWWNKDIVASIDLTHNEWVGELATFKMQGPSLGLNYTLLRRVPLTLRENLFIAWGISYGFHRLKHDLISKYDPIKRISTIGPDDDFIQGSNTLVSRQWSIPIEIQFHANRNHGLHVHLGGKIGYQSGLVEKSRENGTKHKYKHKYDSDKQPWVYSVHARIGFKYGPTLYASYNFNTLFKNSTSTRLNLLEMGFSFLLQ